VKAITYINYESEHFHKAQKNPALAHRVKRRDKTAIDIRALLGS
jgi:hypothetical protein